MSPKKSPNPFSVMDRMKDVGRFGRQVGTGLAGGHSGGLTDVPANAMGVPQSDARDIAGAVGMVSPFGLPVKAVGLGARMASKFLPKAGASMLGRAAVRGVEGAAMGGATQLGNAVQKKSLEPIAEGAVGGGVLGAAIPFRSLPYAGRPKWGQAKLGEALAEADKAGSMVDVTKQMKHIRDILFTKAGSNEAKQALKDKLVAYSEKFNKDLGFILKDKTITKLPPSQAQDVINLLGGGRGNFALQEIRNSLKKGVYDSLTESGKKVYGQYKTGQAIKGVFKGTKDIPKRILRKWVIGQPVQ